MNVNMTLALDDARFLHAQLARHVEAMQIELAHTESHDLQHQLARDLGHMQRIAGELESLLQKASGRPTVPQQPERT